MQLAPELLKLPILYIYLNGVYTSQFEACSVNNKGCVEEAIIIK